MGGFDSLADGRLLRGSVLALLAYGGLLVLIGWVFNKAPTGFVPHSPNFASIFVVLDVRETSPT